MTLTNCIIERIEDANKKREKINEEAANKRSTLDEVGLILAAISINGESQGLRDAAGEILYHVEKLHDTINDAIEGSDLAATLSGDGGNPDEKISSIGVNVGLRIALVAITRELIGSVPNKPEYADYYKEDKLMGGALEALVGIAKEHGNQKGTEE